MNLGVFKTEPERNIQLLTARKAHFKVYNCLGINTINVNDLFLDMCSRM